MQRGRPSKTADAQPLKVWSIQATVTLLPDVLEAEALRRAAFIIGTEPGGGTPGADEAILQYVGNPWWKKGLRF